jgi:hypothetical protein
MFQTALANYFATHGSSSRTNITGLVNREVEKLYKHIHKYNNKIRTPNTLVAPGRYQRFQIGTYGGYEPFNLPIAKNAVRRRTMNNLSMKAFFGKEKSVVSNLVENYLRKTWKNTGKYAWEHWQNKPMLKPNVGRKYKIFRKPNGTLTYLNSKGQWQPFPSQTVKRFITGYGNSATLNQRGLWTNENKNGMTTYWSYQKNGTWRGVRINKTGVWEFKNGMWKKHK